MKRQSQNIDEVGEDPSEANGFLEVLQKEISVSIKGAESDKKFK